MRARSFAFRAKLTTPHPHLWPQFNSHFLDHPLSLFHFSVSNTCDVCDNISERFAAIPKTALTRLDLISAFRLFMLGYWTGYVTFFSFKAQMIHSIWMAGMSIIQLKGRASQSTTLHSDIWIINSIKLGLLTASIATRYFHCLILFYFYFSFILMIEYIVFL